MGSKIKYHYAIYSLKNKFKEQTTLAHDLTAHSQKPNKFEQLLETIKTELSEYSMVQLLTKLPRAEEVIQQKTGRKHRLWGTTRMKILLAVLEPLVLPGKYADLLHRTGFKESEIYPFRKILVLERVLKTQFAKQKIKLVRQALQLITEADIELDLKRQAKRVLIQVTTQSSYIPVVKSSSILAGIAIKTAAELSAQEIPTRRICRAVGCSYLPQVKVHEFLHVVKSGLKPVNHPKRY